MEVIRAFIAIDLSPGIRQQLDEISKQLQSLIKPSIVRWVPARNIHLTLKFLGEVSSTNLEVLTQIIKGEVQRHRCFDIKIGGLSAFPTVHRPRVIWIGVQAPQNLMALQHSIEGETLRLGYTAEERPFSAHLTLGRVSHNASPDEIRLVGDQVSQCKVGDLGTVHVEDVMLFKSDLRPGGAIYTPLVHARLSN